MARKGRSVDEFYAIFREIPKKAEKAVLEAFRKRFDRLVSQSLSTSTSAAGRPLRPTVKGRAPSFSKSGYTIAIEGNRVVVKLDNPLAFHQTGVYRENPDGTVWRLPRRPVIPYQALNARWAKALQDEAEATLFRLANSL